VKIFDLEDKIYLLNLLLEFTTSKDKVVTKKNHGERKTLEERREQQLEPSN
jgi:hypothetical protein